MPFMVSSITATGDIITVAILAFFLIGVLVASVILIKDDDPNARYRFPPDWPMGF